MGYQSRSPIHKNAEYHNRNGTSYISEKWLTEPPDPTDVFTESYLEKRGWVGTAHWIITDYFSDEFEQKVRDWTGHYGVKHLEDAVVYWCRENCTGRWDRFFKYGVEFELEEDLFLFKLSWG